MTRTSLLALLVSGASVASGASGAGCSASDGTTPPAAPAPVAAPAPAAPPAEPTAAPPATPPAAVKPITPTFPTVQSRGGPVIAKPRVVPILFSSDPLKDAITDFSQKLAVSKFWADTASEYGVGAIEAATPIIVTEAPPTSITSTQIETWLAGKLAGESPEFGAPDASTLYEIFYPEGVTVTMEGAGDMGQSCHGYGGYHSEIAAGGKSVGYAMLPRCSDMKELTVAASHEIYEWATDPFPMTNPAFAKLDDAHWAWQAAMIGELGDLCTFLDRDDPHPAEIGYDVQRFWSNHLSLAGSFPCAPKKDVSYIQAIARADDDATVPDYGPHGGYLTTKAVRVASGKSKDVDVLVYSDNPSEKPVVLRAMSLDELYGKKSTSGFSYHVTSAPVAVGSTVKVTVDAPSEVGYDVLIMMTVNGAHEASFWPVLITNDDAASAQAGHPSVSADMLPRFASRDRRVRFTRVGRGHVL